MFVGLLFLFVCSLAAFFYCLIILGNSEMILFSGIAVLISTIFIIIYGFIRKRKKDEKTEKNRSTCDPLECGADICSDVACDSCDCNPSC